MQLVREDVQQHFGVGRGVDVPAVDPEHLVLQLHPVRQIAVVREDDAERRVDVKRLRFFLVRRRTGRRIAHLPDADVARQAAHVARAEHVAHHAVGFVHVEVVAVRRGDSRRILPAMLQEQQAVIDELIDGALGNYTYDAAHGMVLQRVETVERRAGVAPGRTSPASGRVRRRKWPSRVPRVACRSSIVRRLAPCRLTAARRAHTRRAYREKRFNPRTPCSAMGRSSA